MVGLEWIDILDFGSCKASVCIHALLGDGQSLEIKNLTIFHAVDGAGTGAEELLASTESAVINAPGGGGEVSGQLSLDADLSGAHRYLQIGYEIDLSRADTDTCEHVGLLVLGGASTLPVTQ